MACISRGWRRYTSHDGDTCAYAFSYSRSDLKLSGNQYNWISSIIYFGAIVAVFPSLFLMQKIPTGKWLSFNASIWGLILMCSAACKSFGGLLAARFILGLFEACIFAGFGLVISAYWTKPEQTWRTAVIFSTLSSVVNGLLSYAAAHYTGSLGQWQVLFLSVGGLTFAWSILCWLFLAGTPLEARWMSTREKVIAVRRTAGNRTGVANRVSYFQMPEHSILEKVSDFWHYCVSLDFQEVASLRGLLGP
jgi:ACS family allantoate permease-like MFS transporter